MKAAAMMQGSHTVLRAAEETDLQFLQRLRNDVPLQLLLMAVPRPNSMRRVREWLAAISADERRVLFVISARRTGRALGYAQLNHVEPLHGTAELGICLAAEAQGKGHGREALGLMEEYAMSILSLRKLGLRVLAGNRPAVTLYRKAGYGNAGLLRSHFYQGGRYHDVLLMEKFLVSGSERKTRKLT